MAVAAAIAGRTAEVLTEDAKRALSRIVHRIREKFHGRPADLAKLAEAQNNPGSDRIAALARAIDQASAEDPQFARDIKSLWAQVNTTVTTAENGVTNVFQGNASKVVQLRDIHGDLNIS